MDKLIKLNPIGDDYKSILKILSKNKKITEIEKEFQDFVTEKSLKCIDKQTQEHKINILINVEKCNYSIILRKLRELNQLNEIIKQDKIKRLIRECSNIVIKNWNSNIENQIKLLKSGIENRNINELSKVLKEYLRVIYLHESDSAVCLGKEFLQTETENAISARKLNQVLEKQFDMIMNDDELNQLATYFDVTLKSRNSKEGSPFTELPIKSITTRLAQADGIVKYLKSVKYQEISIFETKLNKLLESINNTLKTATNTATRFINENDFENSKYDREHNFDIVHSIMSHLGMLLCVDEEKIDELTNVTVFIIIYKNV